jgi:SP family xylose:H+ symportor-like MFS transporter
MQSKNYILFIALSAALGGLLFGYDTAVISGAIGNLTEFFHLSPVETGWAISSAIIITIKSSGNNNCSIKLIKE